MSKRQLSDLSIHFCFVESHNSDFDKVQRTNITTDVRCRGCGPKMSQRIGPFLAGLGVVTAAYISGRVRLHGLRPEQSLPNSFLPGMIDVPMQALIWERAERISEVWPGGPPPKQPLPVRALSSLSVTHICSANNHTFWLIL